MKSCLKPVVDFESNLKSVKSYKWFHPKIISKWQSHKQSVKVYRLSLKMSASVKNVVAITFMCPIIKVFYL